MDSCKMRKRRASPSSSWLTTPATQALVDYWTTFVRLFRLNLRQRWPAWPTMNNNTLSIAQDLTNDHNKASKALRIPLGNPGAHGSPYLSLAVPFSSTGSSFAMGMVRKTKLPCVTRFLPVARLVPLSCPATGALYKAWNCGTEKRIGEPARPSAYTDSDRTE